MGKPLNLPVCMAGSLWALTHHAILFATALERSLADIPDTNPLIEWNISSWAMDDFPEWLSPDEIAFMEDNLEEFEQDVSELHPYTFFAGNEKKHLTDLIRFCKLGSFLIL